MKPRIAIPVPTTTDFTYNRRSWPTYAECVASSGGEPIEIPLDLPAGQVLALARTCQGVCLPGSPADVEPTLYGAERDPATAAPDPARESVDTLLLEDAEKHSKPVLAICYGVQILNAWRGGSLVQDLTPLPVNHSAGSRVAIAHTVLVAEHSGLAAILAADGAAAEEAPAQDGFLRLPVNTSHHQAVAALGDRLRIVARCPDDGTIEAVELDPPVEHHADHRPQFVLGVQWHPERSYAISAASRALFDKLVREAQSIPTETTLHANAL